MVNHRLWDQFFRNGRLLIGLVLIGVSVILFVSIQDPVRRGAPLPFDEAGLLFFRVPDAPELLRGPSWMERLCRDLSALGSRPVLTLVTLVASGFFLLLRRFQALALIWLTAITGTLLMGGLKDFYARPRPEVIPGLSEVFSLSFPSGHSMMSAMIYGSLAVLVASFVNERGIRIFLIGLAASLVMLIGLTRIILGVHFPSDVVAGWSIGLIWVVMLSWVLSRVDRSRQD